MTLTADQHVGEFCNLVNRGIEAWKEAGALLCKMVDKDATVISRIAKENPHLTRPILEAFVRIGRKELYPFLLVDSSPGARALAGLPYDQQTQIYHQGVRIARRVRGTVVEVKVKIQDLNSTESHRVFDIDRLRTMKEQRDLLRPSPNFSTRSTLPTIAPAPLAPSEESIVAGPQQQLASAIEKVHTALFEAREALSMLEPSSSLDNHITAALTAAGKLRLAVNDRWGKKAE